MFIHKAASPARRVLYFAFATVCAISVSVFPAMAQTESSHSSNDGFSDGFSHANFSSSTDGLSPAATEGYVAAPPALYGAAERHDVSYGYHDHSWTNRIAFEAGGGFNAPIGNDEPFITWGGNFTVGAGLHLQRHLSLLAEYQFMDNKLPGALISDAGAQGGHAHIWSLTLDPVVDLFPARKNDVYVTGGGGFYRKVTSFTDPEEVIQCYYFCEVGVVDVVVSHFSSNQGGLNFGVGFTRKLSSDSNLKAFAEARYVWINTPGLGEQDGLGTTGLIPVTFGLRW
ncbi:porin family protein [Acidicapsa ligni]|uniref:porin family protein n=1 Tax=Acidicapsa ligni TaxID=542300 RepID=UPI0021E08C51|nr:porin family protein [Acidicapsa ligni]